MICSRSGGPSKGESLNMLLMSRHPLGAYVELCAGLFYLRVIMIGGGNGLDRI